MVGSDREFIKIARCIALAKQHECTPEEVALQLYGESPRDKHIPALLRKEAVGSHGTTGTGAELYKPAKVAADFVAALRPLTVLGRLSTIGVPFNTQLSYISAKTVFDFVGERTAIAAYAPDFATPWHLDLTKIAGIVVMSNELLARSQSEDVLRRDVGDNLIEASDRRLLDPSSDDDSGARPAAITNGAAEVDASGATTSDDVDAVAAELIQTLVTAGSTLVRARFVARNDMCIALSMLRDTNGARAFPNVNARGGELAGIELLASASSPANQLTIVDGGELLVADDSMAEISLSRETMLDQDSAPEGATRVSMFTSDSTAIKVVRYINWRMRRSGFVAYASGLDIPLPEISTE